MFDYFLKIPGIEGESVRYQHQGEIELERFSWSEEQGAGMVQLREAECMAPISKASPRLLLACAAGERFERAEVICSPQMHESPVAFKLIFSMVLVAAYEIVGEPGGVPKERVKLQYGKVECEYRERRPDGTLGAPIRSGFDAVSNQAIPLSGPGAAPVPQPRQRARARRPRKEA